MIMNVMLAKLAPAVKYVIIGVLVVLFIVGVVLFYVFVVSRNRQRKTAHDLERRYSKIHDLLTGDIYSGVERLANISEQNPDYEVHFENFSKSYTDILENCDKTSYVAISGLNQKVANKEFRGLSAIIESTKITVNQFEKATSKIFEDLNALLQKDEEIRQKEVTLQRKYRSLKEKYNEHEDELSIMQNVFQRIFAKIDSLFKECDDLSNSARFEESVEKLPYISSLLTELDNQFDELPTYCIRISKIIPQKMDDIINKYNELEEKNYPLHHLKINSTLEIFKNTLSKLTDDLLAFKLDNIKPTLDKIDATILEILKALENEEKCKEFFDGNWQGIYDSTYDVEKKFMKIKRQLPGYKNVYLLRDKYLDKIDELEKDIDKVGTIKRDLDTYIHSSLKQPYSFIVQKINELQNEVKRIDEIIDDFQSYLSSLKKDTENAYFKICDYFKKLKDAQYAVREIAVNDYSETMKNKFDIAYDYLEQIGDIIKVQPIDVARANETLQSAEENITGLLREVNEQVGQRKYAEETIVYANQYLQDFAEVSFGLNSASNSFFQGYFTETIDETVAIIKKIRPEVSTNEK